VRHFRSVVVLALCLGLPLLTGAVSNAVVSCTATPPTSTETGLAYTCCEAADVNRNYEPGDTLAIHWVVATAEFSTGGQRREVELNVRLTGPYATVSDLKQEGDKTGSGRFTFMAESIRPSGQPGEQPVSLVLIPLTAPPGFYDLTTAVSESVGAAAR
jgi:hypothetical protein